VLTKGEGRLLIQRNTSGSTRKMLLDHRNSLNPLQSASRVTNQFGMKNSLAYMLPGACIACSLQEVRAQTSAQFTTNKSRRPCLISVDSLQTKLISPAPPRPRQCWSLLCKCYKRRAHERALSIETRVMRMAMPGLPFQRTCCTDNPTIALLDT
jgi:hypothetical protein